MKPSHIASCIASASWPSRSSEQEHVCCRCRPCMAGMTWDGTAHGTELCSVSTPDLRGVNSDKWLGSLATNSPSSAQRFARYPSLTVDSSLRSLRTPSCSSTTTSRPLGRQFVLRLLPRQHVALPSYLSPLLQGSDWVPGIRPFWSAPAWHSVQGVGDPPRASQWWRATLSSRCCRLDPGDNALEAPIHVDTGFFRR